MKENLIECLRFCAEDDSDCMNCARWDYDCGSSKCVNDLLLTAAIALEEKQAISDKNNRWIPVTERLPENEKPFQEYLVTVCRDHFPTSSYDFCDAPYAEEYTTTACFDSRNKLWHLCREEVVLNALIMPEDSPLNGECVTAWADMPIPYC